MPKKKAAVVKKAKAEQKDSECARANAALWELRLKASEQSLAECGAACYKLTRVNGELTERLTRMEKDSLDITSLWKTRDEAKEEKINALQKSLSQAALAREEQNRLQVEHYTLQINEVKEQLRKKTSDFNKIQDGMREIMEFQKKKVQMEQELIDIRERMDVAEKEHRENLNKMECYFFKEKERLEKDAEQKIARVVEKAYNEAIVQLDDASRSAFKENVRLNEALKYHMKEAEDLARENASLALDKETFELKVKENAVQNKELSKLKAKVAALEKALLLKARECEPEKEKEKEKEKEETQLSIQAGQIELEKLQKVLSMRERELGRVKQLASTIVEQRTELEQFFYEALAQVRQEIAASRQQYKKEALQAYRWRMREATAGRLKFPPIRTFHEGPHSTNSVYTDMEAAAVWTHQPGDKVELSDLTWEQKEQVLGLLFAKMNGQKERKATQHLALSVSSKKKSLTDSDAARIREELPSPATFITQAPEPVLPSNPNSPPDIHTA